MLYREDQLASLRIPDKGFRRCVKFRGVVVMPMLTGVSDEAGWIEPDDVPRAIVTYGVSFEHLSSFELTPHSHARSQLLLVQRGALSCELEGGLWIVPPRSAIWIPGGSVHAIKTGSALEGYAAFVWSEAVASLPSSCRVVSVTPLLRELLIRCADLPLLYEEQGPPARLVAVLIDELASARSEALHLPMPRDPRLRRIVDLMLACPSDRATLGIWASRVGMSGRTMERTILRETGMTFTRWRHQLATMLAVELLANGVPIQVVAAKLGYQSAPAFVTMFRKILGTPPGRYMVERGKESRSTR